MSAVKPIARSIVSLNLTKPVSALVTAAKAIVAAMTGNTSFATPDPALAVISNDIDALATAETAAQARTHGAAAVRNDKRAALVTALEQLKAYVQKTVDANPANAAALIQSAGMNVKKAAPHPKRVFAATDGAVSGSVNLITEAAARRASYEWQYSTDGAKTWILVPPTLQAKTTITGMTAGTTVAFRYRSVVKTGAADWSQPVQIIVK